MTKIVFLCVKNSGIRQKICDNLSKMRQVWYNKGQTGITKKVERGRIL